MSDLHTHTHTHTHLSYLGRRKEEGRKDTSPTPITHCTFSPAGFSSLTLHPVGAETCLQPRMLWASQIRASETQFTVDHLWCTTLPASSSLSEWSYHCPSQNYGCRSPLSLTPSSFPSPAPPSINLSLSPFSPAFLIVLESLLIWVGCLTLVDI